MLVKLLLDNSYSSLRDSMVEVSSSLCIASKAFSSGKSMITCLSPMPKPIKQSKYVSFSFSWCSKCLSSVSETPILVSIMRDSGAFWPEIGLYSPAWLSEASLVNYFRFFGKF
jgi:hypothetical protein